MKLHFLWTPLNIKEKKKAHLSDSCGMRLLAQWIHIAMETDTLQEDDLGLSKLQSLPKLKCTGLTRCK